MHSPQRHSSSPPPSSSISPSLRPLSPSSATSTDCVICLNPCTNRAVLTTCLHAFCFHCILQWSMLSRSCPLCVQPFTACQQQTTVATADENESSLFAVHQFEPRATNSTSSTLLLSSPTTSHSTHLNHVEGSSSSSSTSFQGLVIPHGIIRRLYGPPQHRPRNNNNYYNNNRRGGGGGGGGGRDYYSTREETIEEQTVSLTQQQAFEKRTRIYTKNLRAKHIGSNRISGFQQITPETFVVFPHLLDRLSPWIRRELRVIFELGRLIDSTDQSNDTDDDRKETEEEESGMELVREYILAVMKVYDLQTDKGLELLRRFLHGRTELFVHELIAFARAPYSMEAYDRIVQYDDDSDVGQQQNSQQQYRRYHHHHHHQSRRGSGTGSRFQETLDRQRVCEIGSSSGSSTKQGSKRSSQGTTSNNDESHQNQQTATTITKSRTMKPRIQYTHDTPTQSFSSASSTSPTFSSAASTPSSVSSLGSTSSSISSSSTTILSGSKFSAASSFARPDIDVLLRQKLAKEQDLYNRRHQQQQQQQQQQQHEKFLNRK